MKPKHQGGYTPDHTVLCERTLVTLLRGLGPWKQGIYIVGGLAPRYLISQTEDAEELPRHIGTTDVDLVLNLALLGEVEAYRRLEKNLKILGFERGKNDEDAPQHFRWLKPAGQGIASVASEFSTLMAKLPDDPLLKRALDILQTRFGTAVVEGHRKDGPQSYARFLADPGRSERDRLHRRNAATVVEAFLLQVKRS